MKAKRITIAVLKDIHHNGHTYVEGDNIEDLEVPQAERFVRAGKASPVASESEGNLEQLGQDESFPDPFQDPGEEVTDQQQPPLETATPNRPGKPNGKPRPPKVD